MARQGQLRRARQQLNQLDHDVLRSLHRLRLLTCRQLQRLHVVDRSPVTQLRRAQALLARLQTLGVVSRAKRRIGGIRAGSTGFIYSLSGLGQAALEVCSPYTRRRKIRETKPAFQDHILAVAELCVRLTEGARQSTYDLLRFDGEPAAWRRFTGSGGPILLKPDAYVQLATRAYEYSLFVEVELCNKSEETIRRKCQRYIAYWRSGVEQQRHGVFPRVLWLVSSEKQHQQIHRVVAELPTEAQPLFMVALQCEARQLVEGWQ